MELNEIFDETKYSEAYDYVCSHEYTQIIEVEKQDGKRMFKIVSIEDEMKSYEIEAQIQELKDKLSASDYKVMKYIEGKISEVDFLTIKSERQAWRDKINQLEQNL